MENHFKQFILKDSYKTEDYDPNAAGEPEELTAVEEEFEDVDSEEEKKKKKKKKDKKKKKEEWCCGF